jgi:hypothetical protein
MIAPSSAQTYDVICLQMRNYLPRQQGLVRGETLGFMDGVRKIVTSGQQIRAQIKDFIPQIFSFRMLALKWIVQQPDIDFLHLIENSYPSLEALRDNSRLEILGENVLFALRCSERITGWIIEGTTSEALTEEFEHAPATYEEFFSYLNDNIGDDELLRVFIAFSHTTLYIEFITVAALIISDEHIAVSDAAIDELAFLVADAAQTYSAIAKLIGIVPKRPKAQQRDFGNDVSINDEDQLLSELGLGDFDLNF